MKYRLSLLSILLVSSCTVEPVALVYNKDACHHCKMTLIDKRFGAELVSIKGKVFKFDDANCMINYFNESKMDDREIAYTMIIDYTQPEKLIEAESAFYLKSSEIHSPMNSQIAAFESYDTMNIYKKRTKGIYLSWGELVTQFK